MPNSALDDLGFGDPNASAVPQASATGSDISGGYHISKPPPPLPNEPDASLLARVAVAEDPKSLSGQQAVMGALLQRQVLSGKPIADLIREPGAIQTYWNGTVQNVDTSSPRYQAALAAAQTAKPTPGLDSWYSPAGIKAQGFGKPPFDPSTGTQIGGQLFGSGYAPHGKSGSALDDLGFGDSSAGGSGTPSPSAEQAKPRALGSTPVPVSSAPNAQGSVWDPTNKVWRSPSGTVLHVGDGPETDFTPGERQIVPAGSANQYTVPGDPSKTVYTRDTKDPTLFTDPGGAQYRIVGSDQKSQQAVQNYLKANPLDPGNSPDQYGVSGATEPLQRAGVGIAQGAANVVNSLGGAQLAIKSNPVGNLLLNAVAPGQAGYTPAMMRADLARGVLDRSANETAYGGSPSYGLGKFGGEAALTVPAMLATEGGAGALADASGLTDFAAGVGGNSLISRLPGAVASSAGKGAFYGAQGAALTSAGSSAPLSQQVAQGAETGAVAGPVLGALGVPARGVGRFIGNTVKPFLPGGASSMADSSLGAMSGNALLDLNEYVPGAKPTFAQALPESNQAAKTAAAVQQRTLMQDPATNGPIAQTLSDADKARAAEVESLTEGGDQSVPAQMKATRDAVTSPLREAAFADKKPVDPTPVVDVIDNILAGPAGQRDPVVSTLSKLRAKLVQSTDLPGVGQLQTDPEQLYGIRQSIDDMTSPLSDEKGGRLAKAQLQQVRQALDPVIAEGAPGYPAYMQQHAQLSQPINALEYLQSLKLGGNSGTPTLAGVNRAVSAMESDLNAPGIQDAKSLSPDQIQRVYNLQASLKQADLTPSLKYAARTPNITGNADNSSWVNALLQHPAANLAVDVAGAAHPALGFTLGAGKAGVQLGSGLVKRALAQRVANPETIQPFKVPSGRLTPNPLLSVAGIAAGQTPSNKFGF